MPRFITTSKSSRKNRSRKSRKTRSKRGPLSLETLQSRELLAADFMWQGDALQITGSDENDFIAVQEDSLGTKVFTDEAVHVQHEGRLFSTATSISISGGDGNDILFNHQSSAPVTLSGEGGNDFLLSDNPSDVLDGGEGSNWISEQSQGAWENALGIEGLDLNLNIPSGMPQIDENNHIGLQVEVGGEMDIAGQPVGVTGVVDLSSTGTDVSVTGTIESWTNAFGIDGFDLTDTSLTLTAGTDVHEGNGYGVELSSSMNVEGTDIEITGSVDITENLVSAAFTGAVTSWDNAFGIAQLDVRNAEIAVSGSVDANDDTELSIGIDAEMLVEGAQFDVSGGVHISSEMIEAELHASVDNWNDAFGITGLTLTDSELNVAGYTNRSDDYGLHIDLLADMEVEGTNIRVTGSADLAPDRIDANLHGSVANWDGAFGIDGLNLNQTDLDVTAYSNRSDDYSLQFELASEMDIEGTGVNVHGLVDIEPNRTAAVLNGTVAANWNDAFGIEGLTLNNTGLSVNATLDKTIGSSVGIDIDAGMDIGGTNVDVSGSVDVNPAGMNGSLTGTVSGEWAGALQIVGLDLIDTTIGVSVSQTAAGSELALGLGASMDLLGTNIAVNGTAAFTADGVNASLTGSVDGEWVDAFGISTLQLQDTSLTIAADSTTSGLDIELDTGLQLFGDYIDVVGNLNIDPSGLDISFSPPGSLDFTDLLGIPGFSLDNTDLLVTVGTDGLEAAVFATVDMGIEVDFEGAFTIGRTDVSASLTGRVDSWNNAFDVPGLNLNDIVMTLGAESGVQGASMFIGLGAGMNIGDKQLDVAGLVGVGVTGWDVAFRGSIDSLETSDLIDFANAITLAGDPNAPEIPADALGDLEMRDAYVNFAPNGGNEALGIDDGFGIGGDFYEEGELLAGGEFAVDLLHASFEVNLDIPELGLGPVELSDVMMDVRIAPFGSYQKVSGTGELMGSNVHLRGELYSNGSFLLTGHGNVQIDGLAASAVFTVDNSGILFDAIASGAAVNAIKGSVTGSLLAVASDAQTAIDNAQAVVNGARADVSRLESQLATARANAQREVDAIKEDLDAAKSVVDSARSSKNYWYNVRKSRYNSWKSAIRTTNRAPWYNKPYYKAIEAGKYSSYIAAAGTYSAKVATYNVAVAAYNAVRDAAGWALDAAGVDANPEVIALSASLAVSNLAVNTAESVLNEIEQVNSDALQYLSIADSLRVEKMTLSGNVSNYVNAGVEVTIDYFFAGNNHSLTLHASTEDLVNQLASELLNAIS